MFQLDGLGPCSTATYSLQLINTLGLMFNAALVSWLAHRRLLADRRENGKHHGPGPQTEKGVVAYGPSKRVRRVSDAPEP